MFWTKKKTVKAPTSVDGIPAPIDARVDKVRDRWRAFQKDRTLRHPRQRVLRERLPIVTMGSCFANELRAYLLEEGIGEVAPRVPDGVRGRIHDHSKEETSWGEWDGRSNLQWYNTFTLRQEVERAVGLWPHDPDDHWKVERDGEVLYQCPYRRRLFARTPEDLAVVTRAIDGEVRDGFERAELIIWTLGLVEVWRKKDNGRFSCAEPGYCHGGGKEETEFHLSEYGENLENVRRGIELLREHFGPKKVVLTVSPVPLGRTFREDTDIAIANMESKSTLRAVAGTISRQLEDVEYFPAYELCMLDPRAFREDGRHVQRGKVRQIMDFFVASHR